MTICGKVKQCFAQPKSTVVIQNAAVLWTIAELNHPMLSKTIVQERICYATLPVAWSETKGYSLETHLELRTATKGGVLLPILRSKSLGRNLLRLMKRVRLTECLLKNGMIPSPRLCSTCSTRKATLNTFSTQHLKLVVMLMMAFPMQPEITGKRRKGVPAGMTY